MNSTSNDLREISRHRLVEWGVGPSLPADLVDSLLNDEGLQRDRDGYARLMMRLLPRARRMARASSSGFSVGAWLLGKSGALHSGANIEFPDHPLFATIHAEQAAFVVAKQAGETALVGLAVTATPCGLCRQFLSESMTDRPLWIVTSQGLRTDLDELLPHRFGPSDLGIDQSPLGPSDRSGSDVLSIDEDEETEAAFEALLHSHAPYTRARAGLAFGLDSGTIIAGEVIENAAFNPSLTPLQTAVVQLTMRGLNIDAVQRVTLVEEKGASLSYLGSTLLWLEALEDEAGSRSSLTSRLRHRTIEPSSFVR